MARTTDQEDVVMPGIADRAYVVTGGASGIGRAVVDALVDAGARVMALDVNQAGLEAAAGRHAGTARLWTRRCDIANDADVADAIAAAVAEMGGLDGLVNAAGVVVTSRFLEFSEEAWIRAFRVNVVGSYLTLKHSAPHLAAGDGGRVVNVASMAAKIPNQYTAPYAASKAAVISLTKSAAAALAPAVTVNAVCPGIIDTPMWQELEVEYAAIGAPLNFRDRAADAPLARPGLPADVADAIVALLSDANRFVTGEDLNVTGGLVMH